MKKFSSQDLFKSVNAKLHKQFGAFAAKVKRVLPAALFVVPGGAGMALWYMNANRLARQATEMNQAIANAEAQQAAQEFLSKINAIDAHDMRMADKAAFEELNGVYDGDKYGEICARELGLNREQFVQFNDMFNEVLENSGHYPGGIDQEVIENTARELGYGSYDEMVEVWQPIIDRAMQGDPASIAACEAMDYNFVETAVEIHYLDPLKEQAPEMVSDMYQAAPVDEITTNAMLGATWEEGVLVAAATAGAALVGYGLSVRNSRKAQEAAQATTAANDRSVSQYQDDEMVR